MRVLVVGQGAREHALAWKIAQSRSCDEVHAAPGNPGIAQLGECHPVRADDGEGLLGLCRALGVDLAVIGPEAPLVAGIADELRHAGISVFGPGSAAARIEGSKRFAKEVMVSAGVATAAPLAVARVPCVVKADGLAEGKGVFVCHDDEELEAGVRAAARFGDGVVIEELLEGEEVSVFALCDGSTVVPLAAAQDYKRVDDGDRGPNTGGMGAFTPVPGIGADDLADLVDRIHRPVLAELARRGSPFVGVLFAGLMLTADGPRVLEFNCRFGDPETQAIVPTLDDDFLELLAATASGTLEGVAPEPSHETAAVTVVVAAANYPASGDSGTPIDGIERAEAAGAVVFHAGTARHDGRLITNGGRILSVTGCGRDVGEARETAYAGVAEIDFAGARHRTDIALAALEGSRVLG